MSNLINIPTRFEALKLVAAAFETQQAMADAFGVTQPTICRWLSQSKQLPVEHVLRAEELTGVSRHWTRPDFYPVEHAGPPMTWNALADLSQVVTFSNRPVSKGDIAPKRAGARR
jgi:DNA-binding transcriptional regulator YdaS (Cro superfamily)